jgi:hypothetical protein
MCGLEKADSAIGGEARLLGLQHESLLIDLWTHPDECGDGTNVIPAAYEVKLKGVGPLLRRRAWRTAG